MSDNYNNNSSNNVRNTEHVPSEGNTDAGPQNRRPQHMRRGCGRDMRFGKNMPPNQMNRRRGSFLPAYGPQHGPHGPHGPVPPYNYNWHGNMPPQHAPSPYQLRQMQMANAGRQQGNNNNCPAPASPPPHFNPTFLRYNAAGAMHGEPRRRNTPSTNVNNVNNGPKPNEAIAPRNEDKASMCSAEIEHLLKINRTISVTATTRAIKAVSNGEYVMANEILNHGIALIEGSKLANDERCKKLITALKLTIEIVEKRRHKQALAGGRRIEDAHRDVLECFRRFSSKFEKSGQQEVNQEVLNGNDVPEPPRNAYRSQYYKEQTDLDENANELKKN